MDPGTVVMVIAAMIFGTATITSVVRHVTRSRHSGQQSLPEIKQALLNDLGPRLGGPEGDSALARRLEELERKADSQQDRMQELEEEIQFLRRLLEDKIQGGGA